MMIVCFLVCVKWVNIERPPAAIIFEFGCINISLCGTYDLNFSDGERWGNNKF